MASVVPKLRAAVLCQHIEFDGNGLPFSLEEPLHTVQLPPEATFPFQPAPMYLYTQLEDANGTFWFRVLTRDETGYEGNRTPQAEVTFDRVSNPVVPTELTFELTGFRFPRPGIYWFHLVCNHASLSDSRETEPQPFPAPRLHVLMRDA